MTSCRGVRTWSLATDQSGFPERLSSFETPASASFLSRRTDEPSNVAALSEHEANIFRMTVLIGAAGLKEYFFEEIRSSASPPFHSAIDSDNVGPFPSRPK